MQDSKLVPHSYVAEWFRDLIDLLRFAASRPIRPYLLAFGQNSHCSLESLAFGAIMASADIVAGKVCVVTGGGSGIGHGRQQRQGLAVERFTTALSHRAEGRPTDFSSDSHALSTG